MGVYIRGMEMPPSCLECRLYNDPWCMAKKRNQWRTSYNRPPKGERQNDCPLVPVPPHGDLIDRAVFREDMDKHYPFDRYTQKQHGWEDAAKTTIIQMLAAAPIIISAEEAE